MIRLRLAINSVCVQTRAKQPGNAVKKMPSDNYRLFENPILPYENWPFPAKRHSNVRLVRAYIFMCRDIPSADDDGQSDCYIKVWNQDGKDLRTEVVDDSLNPIFYETVEFAIDFEKITDMPPIILNLWDHNEYLPDVYLGRAVINVEEHKDQFEGYENEFRQPLQAKDADDLPSKPKWYPIKYTND